ncbi:hypothetical protein GQ457_17G011350 [Hibiscus cannabinus]
MVIVDSTEIPQLHVVFLPFMGHGHMIPMVDMTKLFATSGVKTTIVTTPLSVPFVWTTIERSKNSGIDIDIKVLKWPCVEAGLPEGCENLESIPTSHGVRWDMIRNFFTAIDLFQQPFEQLMQQCKPDCIVVDLFFVWATDTAHKFGIPRLMFNGSGFLSLCISDSINLYQPHKRVESDSEPFVIPNLPGDINYGFIVNSFYELEATYVDHYRNVVGRKAWHIGPVSLCNKIIEDKADRGKKSSIDRHKWQHFIWVVREEDWLPEGFEKRMEGKGLIIRGWAPQVLILEHEATGAFVTHCGWNSTLEGVSAGLPMVTWPMFAEQFYNEKLVTQVLKIGIGVGVRKCVEVVGDFVKRDAIEKAVKGIMVGEKAEEMRSRAKALGETAKGAVENGGSSFRDLNALIPELSSKRR